MSATLSLVKNHQLSKRRDVSAIIRSVASVTYMQGVGQNIYLVNFFITLQPER